MAGQPLALARRFDIRSKLAHTNELNRMWEAVHRRPSGLAQVACRRRPLAFKKPLKLSQSRLIPWRRHRGCPAMMIMASIFRAVLEPCDEGRKLFDRLFVN